MISDIYELSPIQRSMLLQTAFAPESSAYFNQFSCRVEGELNVEVLRQAWQKLADRHAVFRTSFHWEDLDKPMQVVRQQITLPWEFRDWRGIPPETQIEQWTRYLEQDRAKG